LVAQVQACDSSVLFQTPLVILVLRE